MGYVDMWGWGGVCGHVEDVVLGIELRIELMHAGKILYKYLRKTLHLLENQKSRDIHP